MNLPTSYRLPVRLHASPAVLLSCMARAALAFPDVGGIIIHQAMADGRVKATSNNPIFTMWGGTQAADNPFVVRVDRRLKW